MFTLHHGGFKQFLCQSVAVELEFAELLAVAEKDEPNKFFHWISAQVFEDMHKGGRYARDSVPRKMIRKSNKKR